MRGWGRRLIDSKAVRKGTGNEDGVDSNVYSVLTCIFGPCILRYITGWHKPPLRLHTDQNYSIARTHPVPREA